MVSFALCRWYEGKKIENRKKKKRKKRKGEKHRQEGGTMEQPKRKVRRNQNIISTLVLIIVSPFSCFYSYS